MWPQTQGGGGAAGPGQQQGAPQGPGLSVVTTVWGVTQTTQSGPLNHNPSAPNFTNTTMSTTPYSQQQQQQGFPGNHMQKQQIYCNPNMGYRQQTPYRK